MKPPETAFSTYRCSHSRRDPNELRAGARSRQAYAPGAASSLARPRGAMARLPPTGDGHDLYRLLR